MPAPKGHKRYGGRQKGVANRKTQMLQEKCEALGVDPFHVQLLFVKGDWRALGYASEFDEIPSENGTIRERVISPEIRQKATTEICQYLYPKRKAVEHSVDVPQEILDKIDELKQMSDSELKKIVKDE